jgi:hypothetical protein
MAPDESKRFEHQLSSACKLFDEQLPAYSEGVEETSVLLHAAECPACGGVLKDLQQIRAAARELPLDSPPARVWKNVRTALAREALIRQPGPRWLGWLRAPGTPSRLAPATAAAAVAVLGAVFIFGPRLERKPAPLAPQSNLALSALSANYAAEQLALAKTVQQMEQTFKQQETQLPPLIKSTYDKGLSSLDDSIRESLVSVHRNPRDELARQFLMEAYAQKADVLASALEYDGTGR